ncbi:MAG: hypothetical protein FWF54_00120 [Candidatus Azobacteroides sp.]|nr:hypothetical protein [Candidatus Azobacteroides sp.]
MKQIYTIFFLLLFTFGTLDAFSQAWSIKQDADFPGGGREHAVSFVIDNIAYLGRGGTPNFGSNGGSYRSKDFWQYNPQYEQWTQIAADFPGRERAGAVAFVINGKGYVGLGSGNNGNLFKDFYEYTPATRTWTRIADFPGTARYGATAFSIGNAGYVGTGSDRDGSPTGDFYKYENGQWTQIASIPNNTEKEYATSFSIDGYGYIFLGGDILFVTADTTTNTTLPQIHGQQKTTMYLSMKFQAMY